MTETCNERKYTPKHTLLVISRAPIPITFVPKLNRGRWQKKENRTQVHGVSSI